MHVDSRKRRPGSWHCRVDCYFILVGVSACVSDVADFSHFSKWLFCSMHFDFQCGARDGFWAILDRLTSGLVRELALIMVSCLGGED